MARPPFKPTKKDPAIVRAMVAGGIPQEDIASALGIAKKTLRKHFRQEIDTARGLANAKVIASLYHMATNGKNVAASIYWTKALMGWRETPQEIQHSGINGAPIKIEYGWAEEPKLQANKPRLVE